MNPTKPYKKNMRVGRGTQLTLAGVAAFAIYSVLSQPQKPTSLVYEADENGRLVRVDRLQARRSPVPPLWKPEPQDLLDSAAALNLDRTQRDSIGEIASRWSIRRSRLEEALAAEAPDPSQAPRSMNQMATGMARYSELSRSYDRARNEAWGEALSRLTPTQRADVARLGPAGGGGKP